MKKAFLILCLQVAIGRFPPVVSSHEHEKHRSDSGLECYTCHKYDHHHHDDRCHVHYCHDNEFCQIDIGLDNIVDGKCKPRREYNHCLHDMETWCPDYRTVFYYGKCRFCCDDVECVNQALHITGVPSVSTLPPPTTSGTPDCVDLIPDCATTDNVCSNTFAPIVCKKFCNLCDATSSKTTQTTTSTTTTTTTPTSTLPPCMDLVKEDRCHTLPNVCSSNLAGDICPEYCGLCQKVTPAASLPICTSTTREDNCPSVPNVCSDRVAPYFCPEFCGFCTRQGKGTTPTDGTSTVSSTTTVQSTTSSTTSTVTLGAGTCSDHSPVCSSIADICKRQFGLQLCEKTCRTCVSDLSTTLPPSAPVQQTTTYPTTPSNTQPTRPSTLGIQTSSASTCSDNYFLCKPEICHDVDMLVLCPKTCGVCTVSPTHTDLHTTLQASTKAETTSSTQTPTTTKSAGPVNPSTSGTPIPSDLSTPLPTPAPAQTTTSSMTPSTTPAGPVNPPTSGTPTSSVLSTMLPASASAQTTTSSMTPSTTKAASPAYPSTTVIPTRPARSCYLCGNYSTFEPCTLAELTLGIPEVCPSGNYCMTDLFTMLDGSEKVFKRCVNHRDCLRKWYAETSDKSVCTEFSPANNVLDLACHFCCVGDNCNTKIIPETNVLFKP